MEHAELLVKSPTQGLPLQNPYLPIVNRQMVLMTRVASELGFTPCSRARIDAGGAPAPIAEAIGTISQPAEKRDKSTPLAILAPGMVAHKRPVC